MNITKVNNYKFRVESESKPIINWYTVTIRKDKSMHCTCKAFEYQTNECKHIKAVKEYLDYSYIYELTPGELINECLRLIKLTRKLDNIIWRP